MDTKARIQDKALEMFNERGVEYVGLRELAALLDMRVSNITYYFPTKDDLVYHLSLELNRLNSKVIVEKKDLTMLSFLDMLHQVFQNHVQFRCLLLSFVHLMKQNKVMAAKYSETQNVRNATFKTNIQTLAKSGYLELKDNKDVEFLVSSIALISRFWISEAAISYQHLSVDKQIRHYLTIIATLLLPYATVKATKEIQAFLKGLET
jgi:AcrR family transcriptional regulator